MLSLAKKLADMAELEQIRAAAAASAAEKATSSLRAIKIGECDRHIARAGAFLDAAELAMGAS